MPRSFCTVDNLKISFMYALQFIDEAFIRFSQPAVEFSYPTEIDSPARILLSSTKRDDIGFDLVSLMALNFALSPGCCQRSVRARLSWFRPTSCIGMFSTLSYRVCMNICPPSRYRSATLAEKPL